MHLRLESPYSAVYEGVAESINLKTDSWPGLLSGYVYRDDKGGALKRQVDIPTMSIGELKITKSTFWVASRPDKDSATRGDTGSNSAGFLGINMFSHVDLELDLANRILAFYSQDHCPGRVVYWSDDYEKVPLHTGELTSDLYFDALLNGKKVESWLNTSSRANDFSGEFARQIFGLDEHSAGVTSELGPDGKPRLYTSTMSLGIEGLAVNNAHLWLTIGGCTEMTMVHGSIGYGCGIHGVHPMTLGTSILERLHLYLATKEKKMYVTAATSRAVDSGAQPAQNGHPPEEQDDLQRLSY